MKKPSSKIREEISRLQEQLRHAETREAERIGRIALRAGLGEIDIDETELHAVFEEVARRFRGGNGVSSRGKTRASENPPGDSTSALTAGEASGDAGED